MIDLKSYRHDPAPYVQGAAAKGVEIDRPRFDQLDRETRALQTKRDELNAQRNTLSEQIADKKKAGDDAQELIEQVRSLKEQIQQVEEQHDQHTQAFGELLAQIPNPPTGDVPVGADDEDNQVVAEIGEKPSFSFDPKPHRELLEAKGYLDQERAVKLSGSRFQIVRGKFAQLEFALIQRVVQKMTSKGFELALVPQLVRDEAMYTTGFLPNDSMNLYRVNPASPTDQELREEDDLWLIGTAEVPLVAQHSGELFDADQLPLRYVGFSSCYRREAGTYGKDTKGLIRLHQFEKVEMVSFVKPEDSEREHEYLREIEEEIFSELGIPFQRVLICSGDLGAPAAKKYDLEAWFPGIGDYKEVTSTSNTTDFQTRRGAIRYRDDDQKEYVHSLNGTVVALGRTLAAIVENYQTSGGDIEVPTVLQPWMNDAVL